MDDEVLLYNLVSIGSSCYESQKVRQNESIHFCTLKSATRAEFYEALKAGVQASASLEMYSFEYSNEKYADIYGKSYKVVRDFCIPGTEKIELTLSEVI